MKIPGIAHRRTLRAEGVSRRDLERWKHQELVRSVQPWYLTPDAPADLVALLTRGLRPTCLDAAALYGLWVPRHGGTHAYRPRSSARTDDLSDVHVSALRRRDGRPYDAGPPQRLILHAPELRAWPDHDPVPDLVLVLSHAGRCLPTVKAAVLVESALNKRLVSIRQVEQIIASLPHDARRALGRVRADTESGTETTVRWWFEARGVAVRAQVRFPVGNRRMDLLIGRSWVIECDSRAHHSDPVSYDEDRARDLYLASRGFTVTRLSWEQVFLRWSETERRLLSILGSGAHRRAPRSGPDGLAA